MTPTRDFKQTVVERVERDPAFARTMPGEAAMLFFSRDLHIANSFPRELVNVRVGFEGLMTAIPAKSPDRMFSRGGNPVKAA